ncbi:NADP-dependent oxidoreductase [Methanobrevibacter olleyae]|uniref:NADPH:quinone reductase n=1 Tax=Methanobrevibacter olleyae TaxID=294671 RepID=A0A126R2B5_METOL|nr:NADP-dependent oxidoreductase [Methanobrevibacter olleyae]AMK16129.1 zinc-binding dehydrogenase [Methanobrevibacter olleyae]SFL32393.1 NADPH:quinone reductase [Methanobrevibacter olleyae]
MKAAILKKYNKKGNDLEISDIPIPKIDKNEVLVKIKYAGVNPLDNMIIRKEVKLLIPYKLPLVMGNEFSGIVEEIGENVSEFNIGDRVYCRMPLDKIGAFTELTAVDKEAIAKIPDYLSFKEAACIPLTALTAMQSFELMNVKKDESIFISGGTGSLGAMAIPIAKSLGLKVITSGSAPNKERVMKLGVDEFFDYKKEDYSEKLTNIDYVLDTLGDEELEKEFKILKKGGTLVSLKGMPNERFAERMGLSTVKKLLFKILGRKYDNLAKKNQQTYHFIFVESNGKQLEKISKIFENNKLECSIDEIYDLVDVNKALKKVDNRGSKGKTLIKINGD